MSSLIDSVLAFLEDWYRKHPQYSQPAGAK
jgi:hypothetical protein